MKKRSLKKGILAGTIFTAALNFNACAYGPPGGMYMSEDATPEHTNLSETVESSETVPTPDFDPSQNIQAPVYGPPEMMR
ncbi:MAG: hypothetical protein J6M66_05440 [Lachnospiraceae bacterium]|nr:hypothetical protein [Lachnospiraceae bacterium]